MSFLKSLIIAVFASAACAAACPDGAESLGDSCYLFEDGDMTFEEASIRCEKNGGDLVKIDTAEENAFVQKFVENNAPDGVTSMWIGAYLDDRGISWRWHPSNTLVDFNDWVSQREMTSRRDYLCGAISKDNGWGWAMELCEGTRAAVCEQVEVA